MWGAVAFLRSPRTFDHANNAVGLWAGNEQWRSQHI
jgi:hypothetical protein